MELIGILGEEPQKTLVCTFKQTAWAYIRLSASIVDLCPVSAPPGPAFLGWGSSCRPPGLKTATSSRALRSDLRAAYGPSKPLSYSAGNNETCPRKLKLGLASSSHNWTNCEEWDLGGLDSGLDSSGRLIMGSAPIEKKKNRITGLMLSRSQFLLNLFRPTQ